MVMDKEVTKTSVRGARRTMTDSVINYSPTPRQLLLVGLVAAGARGRGGRGKVVAVKARS